VLLLPEQEASQRLATKLKVLMEISNQLASPQDFASLPQKILDLLFQVMRVDRAVLLLANPRTKQLETRGIKVRTGITLNREFYSQKITAYVYSQGVAILTDNAVVDNRFDQAYSIIRQAICAAMCVPLKAGDRNLGVLYVDNLSQTNIYQKEDLEFLTSLANQAAIAIENAHLYQEMQAETARRARLERFFPQAVTRKIEEIGDLGIVETEVTALFSDISGFTELAARMQPRQVITMLNEYFKVMVEDIVFRFEGTLEKYIADALLAVWGSPYRSDDDVTKALQAAIAMQWAMTKLNQKWAEERTFPQIQIHIGLNTGLVAAGNIGSEQLIQYTNIGDTMNVASRICNVAKAGEIVISDSTLAQLQQRGQTSLPVKALELVTVKGKSQPLQLYRVLWQEIPPSPVSAN
jgi:class 3 adenylate cyclase